MLNSRAKKKSLIDKKRKLFKKKKRYIMVFFFKSKIRSPTEAGSSPGPP